MKYTTNTAKYAASELDILSAAATDPENRPLIEPFRDEILALAEKFGASGQSGGSAPFTATAISQAIKKLLLQEPICDITGVDDEWTNVAEYSGGEEVYQNKRCSSLFKKGKDGKPYYLDAIIVKTPSGATYSTNAGAFLGDGTKVYSRNYVKSFPFRPKTFYIDVLEKEIAKDDWEFLIKDEKQLEAAFNYYDRYE